MNTDNPPHPSLNDDPPATGGDSRRPGSLFYTPASLSRFVEALVDGSATRGYDPTCGAGSLLSQVVDHVTSWPVEPGLPAKSQS
jgi:hypothetical protein